MSKKRVIITGATGMVGGCALRICLGYRVFNNYILNLYNSELSVGSD
jgi:hypothetical protein